MPQIIQETPKENKSKSLIGFGIVEFGLVGAFILILLILNYFNILSLSQIFPGQLGFLPHRPLSQSRIGKQTIISPTPKPPIKPSCPVEEKFCDSAKEMTYNGNPALSFDLPSGTEVKTVTEIHDSTSFSIRSKKYNAKGLYQSYIENDICYTLTYLFPFDVEFRKFDEVPLQEGFTVASASSKVINLEDGENIKLLLQLQKRPLETEVPDAQKCRVANLTPKDFGEYQKITKNIFK